PMPTASSIDRPFRNCTYLGTYGFGMKAKRQLLRAQMLADLEEERLTAVAEQIKLCAEIIAECRASVEQCAKILAEGKASAEQVRGLLSRRAAPLKQRLVPPPPRTTGRSSYASGSP